MTTNRTKQDWERFITDAMSAECYVCGATSWRGPMCNLYTDRRVFIACNRCDCFVALPSLKAYRFPTWWERLLVWLGRRRG